MTVSTGKRFFETFVLYLSSLFFTFFMFFSFCLVSGFFQKNQVIFEMIMLSIFSIVNVSIILILYNEKVDFFGFAKFLVFYILFLIFVSVIMKRISESNMTSVSFIPFTLINYFYFVYNYKSVHLYQEFEEQCVGLSKKELKEKLYHNNTIALEYSQNIKTSITSQLFFAVLCIIFYTFEKKYYNDGANSTGLILVCYLFCVFLLFLFFSTNKNEVYYAFLGFDNIFSYRQRIVKTSVVICLIAVFFAIFLSYDKALLNFKFVLSWLKKIVVVESNVIQKKDFKEFQEPKFESLVFTDAYKPQSNSFESILSLLIQGVFALLLLFIVFRYLIKPFFDDKFLAFFKNNKIKHYFQKFFANLKKIFSILFGGSSIELQKYTTVESKSFYDNISEFLKKSKKSKAKKDELDRFTKKYMKLVDWAKSKEISYKKTYGPLEFCKMINVDSAVKAGEIFEKALYSFELVSEAEEIEFNKLIDETIK